MSRNTAGKPTKSIGFSSKCRLFIQDTSGSEVISMVYAVIWLCAIILASMLIIGYALQMNAVSYAAKRVVRYVEVTGIANEHDINMVLDKLLGNADDIEAKATVSSVDTWWNYSERKVQLRSGFTITVTAKYKITLINPASFDGIAISVPIRVVQNGQSEVYWKR